ncbi:MAG: hypothetical protein HOE92_01165 [Euryarchaeota archaeon]|jgi:hypothetical protein|nr:hypothetical protein [Euryarchaeota archaeon]MBT3970806.1 hypothetical protein [Euryarchaeota archaeon]
MAFGKKKSKRRNAPAAGLPLPPLPGAAPLPPPPGLGEMPPLPGTAPAPAPPAPVGNILPPAPESPSLPAEPQTPNTPAQAKEEVEEDDEYSKMWAKRSETPLQQIYGQIDRIGEKDTGSLLDRYSDRFGHELDREIIVLRGQAAEAAKAAVRDAPVVELIGEDVDDDIPAIDEEVETKAEVISDDEPLENDLSADEEEELQEQLSIIENEIRELKPKYKMAKAKGNSRQLKKLKPALQTLMNERKLIMAVLAGEESMDSLLGDDAEVVESDDLFLSFVGIVDDLLGKMPEGAIDEFVASSDFALYQQVASNPSEADDASRENFFNLVDSKLGEMPEDAISAFVASNDFSIYQEMGAYFRS